MDFADFDINGNKQIDRQEFRTYFVDNYASSWQPNDPMGWNDEGFYTTTYIFLDRDRNDRLLRDEWVHGHNYYYGDFLASDFVVYDLNGDQYLSRAEYLAAMKPTAYFVTWDADKNKFLSDIEFADAVFDKWDTNDNGTLDQMEFEKFDKAHTEI
jgi:Ca2+-binding EF-hand superfamily protein